MEKEEKIIETSKEIVQSYLLTTAGRDWGVYAEKFLLKLIEIAQADIKGMQFKGGKDLKPHTPSLSYPNLVLNESGDAIVSIPVRDISPEGYTNYEYIQTAIEQLQTKVLRWEAPKKDRNGNIVYNDAGYPIRKWTSVQLVGKATGEDDINGVIQVRIDAEIWTAMLDFSKGFRTIDMSVARQLKGKYSLRIYQLMSRQQYPITFSIEELKKQWGLTDKYARPDELIKRCILPAKEELDRISPYSFDFKELKSDAPGRGKKPTVAIQFIPKHQIQYEHPTDMLGFDTSQMLKPEVRQYLRNKFGFEFFEINATIDLLYAAQKAMSGADEDHPTLIQFLVNISPLADQADDRKKYVIGAVKRHLKERYNIIYKSKKQMAKEEQALRQANKSRKVANSLDGNMHILGEMFGDGQK